MGVTNQWANESINYKQSMNSSRIHSKSHNKMNKLSNMQSHRIYSRPQFEKENANVNITNKSKEYLKFVKKRTITSSASEINLN